MSEAEMQGKNGSASNGTGSAALAVVSSTTTSTTYALEPVERFENKIVSVSRLKKFETCPLAFRLKYIDQLESEPSGEPAEFGKLVHDALERVYQWVIDQEYSGLVPPEIVVEFWKNAFREAPAEVTGAELYSVGLELLRSHFRRFPEVDHLHILAVEKKFQIRLGRFLFEGYMDRVDKVGDDEILVWDYKTNRILFSTSELEDDIQASTYVIACRVLYPWARKISFAFDMLRFDQTLRAERPVEKLREHADYMIALAERTETLTSFPAIMNPNCVYCDHRKHCPEFRRALTEKHELTAVSEEDIERLCVERERVAALSKIFYDRQRALDGIIKSRLVAGGPFTAGGHAYELIPQFDNDIPTRRAIETVHRYTERPRGDLVEQLCNIKKKTLEEFLFTLDPQPEGKRRQLGAKTRMLKAELEAISERVPSTPRLSSKPVKGKERVKAIDVMASQPPRLNAKPAVTASAVVLATATEPAEYETKSTSVADELGWSRVETVATGPEVVDLDGAVENGSMTLDQAEKLVEKLTDERGKRLIKKRGRFSMTKEQREAEKAAKLAEKERKNQERIAKQRERAATKKAESDAKKAARAAERERSGASGGEVDPRQYQKIWCVLCKQVEVPKPSICDQCASKALD